MTMVTNANEYFIWSDFLKVLSCLVFKTTPLTYQHTSDTIILWK